MTTMQDETGHSAGTLASVERAPSHRVSQRVILADRDGRMFQHEALESYKTPFICAGDRS